MLYISGNEEFLNALADQFRPQVIAAGGQQSIAGEDRVIGTPSFQEFGDSIVRQDPTTGGVSIAAQRGPTYGEQTQRLTATQETLSPGQVIVDTQTGQQIGQGRNRVFAAGDGVQLYDEQGQPIAENVRDPAASSPQDAERRQRAAQAEAERLGSIRQAIGRAREQIGFWTTGPLSGLSRIGGTPAADLAATLDTIEANLSFDALADMRAASPTGGALGSITERELQLLGSTVASLRQSQSPEQLRRNLEIIEQTLGAVESRAGQQPQQPQQPRRRRYNPATGEFE